MVPIKYKDVNNDGIITNGSDADDRTIIGTPIPEIHLRYHQQPKLHGNWDFSIVGSGSQGNQLWVRHLYSTANLDGVFNMVAGAKDRFRVKNGPNPLTGVPGSSNGDHTG